MGVKTDDIKQQNQKTDIQYADNYIRDGKYPEFSFLPGVENIENIL